MLQGNVKSFKLEMQITILRLQGSNGVNLEQAVAQTQMLSSSKLSHSRLPSIENL